MNLNRFLMLIILLIISISCSSTKESTSDTSSTDQEVYVFDDVSEVNVESNSHEAIEIAAEENIDPTKTPPPVTMMEDSAVVEDSYTVQLGAFSTREKAEIFVKDVKIKIDHQLKIVQNENGGLFLVQLPLFQSRNEAEKVRNALWEIPQFSDAFIVKK